MVMPNDCGGSLRPLSAWWCSCDPLELDSCLRSRAAASADPAGLGGGLGRGSGGVLADPNHLRLPGTASVALMCRCQKVVASSFVAPFPSAAATTPQVIQKKKIKKEKKTAEQANRRAVFAVVANANSAGKSAVAPR